MRGPSAEVRRRIGMPELCETAAAAAAAAGVCAHTGKLRGVLAEHGSCCRTKGGSVQGILHFRSLFDGGALCSSALQDRSPQHRIRPDQERPRPKQSFAPHAWQTT